eukprot:scaffold117854_cov18-Prasinocladus_malaysianus.AAC.1
MDTTSCGLHCLVTLSAYFHTAQPTFSHSQHTLNTYITSLLTHMLSRGTPIPVGRQPQPSQARPNLSQPPLQTCHSSIQSSLPVARQPAQRNDNSEWPAGRLALLPLSPDVNATRPLVNSKLCLTY